MQANELESQLAVFADLSMNPKSVGLWPNGIAPHIKAKTFIYDLVRDVEVVPLQHFLMKGYPLAIFSPPDIRLYFRFRLAFGMVLREHGYSSTIAPRVSVWACRHIERPDV